MTQPLFKPRDYQVSAIEAALNWIKYKPDECGFITAAGGSGKSVMIAKVAEAACDMGKRVIILARNEKLLRQNREKIDPRYAVGMYCAGLNEWDATQPITIASIQSIAKLTLSPDLILVDECHNISPDSDDETQYWDFFRRCSNPQIIGFTATPFRTGSGKLQWGKEIISIPIKPLIDGGYIVPPVNKCSHPPDLSNVTIRMGEYAEGELEAIFLQPEALTAAVTKIKQYSHDRNSVLIFCQSLKHSAVLADVMALNDMTAVIVDGGTPKAYLSTILDSFEAREFKYLINCNLLTEGYDSPQVDMIAILRSTISKGLFEQMVYRGTRLYDGKTDFLLLDMGGNLSTHGALGSPYRERGKKEQKKSEGRICPSCETFAPPMSKQCPDCGYEFPEAEASKVNHGTEADTRSATVYSGEIEVYDVHGVMYREHKSKAGNTTLRIDYQCAGTKYGSVSEWLSPYHDNEWARGKVEKMFRERGHVLGSPVNTYSMEDLIWHCQQMKVPTRITVSYTEKFPRITKYEFGEPEPEMSMDDILGGDSIAF